MFYYIFFLVLYIWNILMFETMCFYLGNCTCSVAQVEVAVVYLYHFLPYYYLLFQGRFNNMVPC